MSSLTWIRFHNLHLLLCLHRRSNVMEHKISEINRIITFAGKLTVTFLGRGFLPWVDRVTGNDNIILYRLIKLALSAPVHYPVLSWMLEDLSCKNTDKESMPSLRSRPIIIWGVWWKNGKKCNLTLAMSPTCHGKFPAHVYMPYFLLQASGVLAEDYRLYCDKKTFLKYEFWSSLIFGGVTDIHPSRQKVMYKSPPCHWHRWAQKHDPDACMPPSRGLMVNPLCIFIGNGLGN